MTSCLDKTEQSNLGKTIFGPGGVNRDTKNKSRQLTCILLLAHYLSFWISSAPYQVSYSPFSLPLGKSAEWRALKYCTVISNISAFSSFPEFFMGEENDTTTCIYCNQNLIWRHHAMKKKKRDRYLFGQRHRYSFPQLVEAAIDTISSSFLNDFVGNGRSLKTRTEVKKHIYLFIYFFVWKLFLFILNREQHPLAGVERKRTGARHVALRTASGQLFRLKWRH